MVRRIRSWRIQIPKSAPRGTKIKESFGSRLFDIVDILIVCLLLACVLIPLIHIVAASFSNPSLFVGHKGILLWPEGFSLASYQAVFKNTFLWTGYANTLFIVIVGTVLNVLLSMVAAYCLSRKHVAAGPTIMKLLVFTMYFSGGMIPLYLVVKGVGLYGSRWALILPTLVDTYNLIIMRTAFAGVPDSLEESAKLDGANAWTILWRIMAPLVKPTVAVITLYYAVSHWNSWFNAMLFLRDKTQYPLQLILRQILIQNRHGRHDSRCGLPRERDNPVRDCCGCHTAYPLYLSVRSEVLCQGCYDRRHQGLICTVKKEKLPCAYLMSKMYNGICAGSAEVRPLTRRKRKSPPSSTPMQAVTVYTPMV